MTHISCRRCGQWKRHSARGLCNACYKGAQIEGSLEDYERHNRSPEEWLQLSRRDPSECWPWQGPVDEDGYGLAARSYAHRWVYVHLGGVIPAGLQLDHQCNNRPCVNPKHVIPSTCRDNVLRGNTITAANLAKTHCMHGHEFTPENTYRAPGKPNGRQCRTCKLDWQARTRAMTRSRC